jgi:hypothetical protein
MITQQVAAASSESDSRTAIVLGGTADAPQPLTDAPPGRIILSPTELASIASN